MAIRSEDLAPGGRDALIYRFPRHHAAIARRRRMQVRRRRAALAGILVVMIATFLLATGPSGSAPAGSARAPRAVTVRDGDTLWGLAQRYAPAGVDPRAYVDLLEELNGLDGAIASGMRVRLPR